MEYPGNVAVTRRPEVRVFLCTGSLMSSVCVEGRGIDMVVKSNGSSAMI